MSCIDTDENSGVWRRGLVLRGWEKRCFQALLAAVVLSGGLRSMASDVPSVRQLERYSESLPIIELPAKAADLVSEAPLESKGRLAVRIVRIFLRERHSLAPSLVGEICREEPGVSVATTREAVRLFPESTHSIVKAAIVAAPEYATLICVQASLEEPNRKREVVNAIRRGLPEQVPDFVDTLQSFTNERVESIADAIRTTKNRIGTSRSDTPANPDDAIFNNPVGSPQQQFVVGDIVEIPDDLSGAELIDHFDVILRELLDDPSNPFSDDVVVERYVQ